MQRNINRAMVNGLANFALNSATRIQKRRTRKGKRQIIRMNLANVPRRPGLGSRGPGTIKPRVVAKTIATNVGCAVSELQAPAALSQVGTENISRLQSQGVANTFAVIDHASLNPAEPGLCPMLSGTSNQFQKFRTQVLRFTYIPAASSARDGTIYVAVFPDPQMALPTSMEEMKASGNMRQFPIYGNPQSWTIPVDSLQTAYKNQQIEVKKVYTDDTTLNSSGMLVVACEFCAASIYLGTIDWTYKYTFSLHKLTQGSNSLGGHYQLTPATPEIDIDGTDLVRGYHMFGATAAAGVYRNRMRGVSHFVTIECRDPAAAMVPTIDVGPDGINWTPVPALLNATEVTGALTTSLYCFLVPPASFVQMHWDGILVPGGVCSCFVTSLRNLPMY